MRAVFSLNSGSSSLKFALYTKNDKAQELVLHCRGECDGLPNKLHFFAQDRHGSSVNEVINDKANFTMALTYLLNWIKKNFPQLQLAAAGHRVVHGGSRYKESVNIDDDVLAYLETLSPLAPLHQPHNLAGIRALKSLHPTLPQVACFDTAFHHTQPVLATLFALPHHFWKEGIRRYGFHGLSYRYMAEVLPTLVGRDIPTQRVIVAHLGHGASLCALKDLKSLATTMGLTALDGLPMGTRCGSIDPGVLLYLLSAQKYSTEKLTDLLYNQSGLLGLSGISDDMRVLIESKDPLALEAIDYFCYHIQRQIGSLVAALEGLDLLVFTGGIGENAAPIRQKVCEGLKWLNIEIDPARNLSVLPHQAIELTSSKQWPSVWVIPTDEGIVMAKDVFNLTHLT